MNRHHFKVPKHKLFLRYFSLLLSCQFILTVRRFFMRLLPFIRFESQVSHIVYLSWLVDIDQVRERYPERVHLWERQGKTVFTILSYQHHHFGFRFLGPFRRWMPSPRQSNWRFYLNDTAPKTVIFEQVLIDHALYVVGGRLASDVMPAQYAAKFEHQFDSKQQAIQTEVYLDQDYSFKSHVGIRQEKSLPATWQNLFDSWADAVHFLVDQDHAWAEWVDQPQRMSQGDIQMPVCFEQIQAAEVLALSPPELLKQFQIDADADVFAFVIPALDFHVLNEKILN